MATLVTILNFDSWGYFYSNAHQSFKEKIKKNEMNNIL